MLVIERFTSTTKYVREQTQDGSRDESRSYVDLIKELVDSGVWFYCLQESDKGLRRDFFLFISKNSSSS